PATGSSARRRSAPGSRTATPTRRWARRRSSTSGTPRATRVRATRRGLRSRGRTTRRSAGRRRCPPRPRRPIAPGPSSCARSRWEAVLLPVEALPENIDAVDDPVELVAAVGVGFPEVLDRPELGGDRALPRVERAAVAITHEEDAALLEELTDGGHPDRERGRGVVAPEDRLGPDGVEPMAAGERRR